MNSEPEAPALHRLANGTRGENIGDATTRFPASSNPPPTPLKIHFVKSSCFRVIHANGVWFGGDGQQNLHLTVYNERTATPDLIVVNLSQNGMVIGEDESRRESKEGIIRELEADIVVSIPAAVEFYKMLGENLKNLKAI